ncbi:MAG: hypothetical protein QGH06_09000, partial [Lutibacter sp.]|nr:hypothetical protein [Lutibacter sp.]
MTKILSLVLLFSIPNAYGQKEANFWYFGENAGLDFNNGGPIPLDDGQLNTREGCSSFSDANGNLLFYSDGSTVWNKDHGVMPNGTNLKGNASSSQSAMIIPKPGSNSIYYLFTVGADFDNDDYGFYYYTIDMDADSGLGDVIAGPVDLNDGNASAWSEKVAATRGADCETYWVLSYVSNSFYAYKVDNSGVLSGTPVISNVAYDSGDSRRGYLKITPNGEKIAIAHMREGGLLVYDFDKSTGLVTNEISLPLTGGNGTEPYGAEFSANSEKLYVHASNDHYVDGNEPWSDHWSSLYQFDVGLPTPAAIQASIKLIDDRNLYRGALQLGPDRKIYRSLSATYQSGVAALGVIEEPENDGLACNYQHAAINLASGTLSTQGLPPFISSIFSQIT